MLSYSENILQTLTGKSSLNDVSEEELKNIVRQYSFFAAAQFLLAKKLHADNHNDYKNAIQKSALHFPNILWLNYNLFEETQAEKIPAPIAEENSSQPEIIPAEIVVDEQSEETAKELSQPDIDVIQEEINTEVQPEEKVLETYEPATETNEINIEVLDEPLAETSDDVITAEEETEPNERLSNLLKEQAAAFEKPVEEAEVPVETIPPHRIDYFASQGIKLEEDKADDKLGKQLKRFTDWLKQMKRINPDLSNIESDPAAESRVQNMAEHSNEPKEVVTEAMAEVLVKQGRPEQAIQIYEKLSFINPSKSAYFAAKIQELKP
jgi:tetratricopeptide (TPR) repeat protein